jgi:hypothetical protein
MATKGPHQPTTKLCPADMVSLYKTEQPKNSGFHDPAQYCFRVNLAASRELLRRKISMEINFELASRTISCAC